jgi:hypothetical protein
MTKQEIERLHGQMIVYACTHVLQGLMDKFQDDKEFMPVHQRDIFRKAVKVTDPIMFKLLKNACDVTQKQFYNMANTYEQLPVWHISNGDTEESAIEGMNQKAEILQMVLNNEFKIV